LVVHEEFADQVEYELQRGILQGQLFVLNSDVGKFGYNHENDELFVAELLLEAKQVVADDVEESLVELLEIAVVSTVHKLDSEREQLHQFARVLLHTHALICTAICIRECKPFGLEMFVRLLLSDVAHQETEDGLLNHDLVLFELMHQFLYELDHVDFVFYLNEVI